VLHTDVCLEALAYELPQQVVTSASLFEALAPTLERLRIPAAGLQALTGVEERRFWDEDVPLYSVAAEAARKAVATCGIALSKIGCLISTSVCKDYVEPSMASLVHGELGLSASCLNFDVGNACLAFMNGLSVVASMIDRGQIEAAVVVDAESSRLVTEATVARLLDPSCDADQLREQFAALTLGSGAVAAVVTHRSLATQGHQLRGYVTQADTRYSRLCLGKPTEMITDQRTLLQAGVDLARRTWSLACDTFTWTTENIDTFICHQVGITHHRALFEALKLNEARSFVTFPFLGNVGPASVPLTLALAAEQGVLQKGSRVALMGIGSGLNCSMMDLVW
jgi:acyl-CoA:acyl-CoA alkyltransferase